MKKHTAFLSILFVSLLFVGVGCSFENAFPLSSQCSDDRDCIGNSYCSLGECQPRGGRADDFYDVEAGVDVHGPGDAGLGDSGSGDFRDTADSTSDVKIPDNLDVDDRDVNDPVDVIEIPDVLETPDAIEVPDVIETPDVPFVPECDDGEIHQCKDAHGICVSTYRVCRGGKWGVCEGISKAGVQEEFNIVGPNENVRLAEPGLIKHADCVEPAESGMTYIPAGLFYRGSPANQGELDERPRREIYLTPYFIDTYEVSRRAYRRCIQEQGCSVPSGSNVNCSEQISNLPNVDLDRPIACVSFEQANTYCEKQGKRLATEAEWEKAARGPIGGNDYPTRSFPWGNNWMSWGTLLANMQTIKRNDGICRDSIWRQVSDGYCLERVNLQSRDRGKSYYGLYHMAGNVAEYVRDVYQADYYANSPNVNPVRLSSGVDEIQVVRGGSFSEGQREGRVSYRSIAGGRYTPAHQVGIRCVKDAP